MRNVLHFALVLSVAFLLAVPLFAEAADSSTSPSESTFVYNPPLRGAPSRRVGGATRGSGKADFVLNVLAPDQTGLTTQAQPILYWYASGPSTTSVELTVIAQRAGVRIALVRRYLEFGLFEPHAEPAETARYDPHSAARVAQAERLRRDLGLNYAGAVLACELLDRIRELQARQ